MAEAIVDSVTNLEFATAVVGTCAIGVCSSFSLSAHPC